MGGRRATPLDVPFEAPAGDVRDACNAPASNIKEFTRATRTKPLALLVRPSTVAQGCSRSSAAPVSRSWVGRVRVVGAADVIDALETWQKTDRFGGPFLHRDSIEAAPPGAASNIFRLLSLPPRATVLRGPTRP